MCPRIEDDDPAAKQPPAQLVARFKARVNVAREEFEFAAALHEAWKPMAYDTDLQGRMGMSQATYTFRTIRQALRREVFLALTRLWDTNHRALGMEKIAAALGDTRVINVLAREREQRSAYSDEDHLAVGPDNRDAAVAMFAAMGEEDGRREVALLEKQVKSALARIAEYQRNGPKHSTLVVLKSLRNERLAHRELVPPSIGVQPGIDAHIEEFYLDTQSLIVDLLQISERAHYALDEIGRAHREAAELFWITARGERTEGHPRFRSA